MKCQISFHFQIRKNCIESHVHISPNSDPVSALFRHFKWYPALDVSGGICRTKQKFFQSVLGIFQRSYYQQAFSSFHIVPVGFDQDLISCFIAKLLSGPHARACLCSYPNAQIVFVFLSQVGKKIRENHRAADVTLLVGCRRIFLRPNGLSKFLCQNMTRKS